jgi:hypothetical protein
LIKTLLQQKPPVLNREKRDLVIMKRKASAPILALLISSFLIPLVVEAQPEPPNVNTLGPAVFSGESGNVVILSPKSSTNYENPIQLNFTVEAPGMLGQFGNVGISVDGGVINSVTDFINKSVVQSGPDWYWYRTTVLASVMLPTLSEGNHNVTVYYGWQYLGTPENPSSQRYEVYAHATVNFVVVNVDTTAPSILIQSPRNNSTYNAPDIELTFLVNETVAWMGYSLDGGDNVTVSTNMTLAGFFDGIHCLTIYANDTLGNMGVSETINFTIAVPEPTPEPFPTTLVAAAIASVAVIGAGILFYLVKIKKSSVSQKPR